MSKELSTRVIELAKDTLRIEGEAVLGLEKKLTGQQAVSFSKAIDLLLNCKGRIVVSGIGKSGHIARKIAATFASTGSPAFFVHPAEASHGDLGMIETRDTVLAISNSGESDELAIILPVLKRLGVPIVAMTGQAQSALAHHADCRADRHASRDDGVPCRERQSENADCNFVTTDDFDRIELLQKILK